VTVLHDLNMALRYAHEIIVLSDGQALAQGPATDVLTPSVIARAFSVDARVERCSKGMPYLMVDDLLET